MRHTDRLLLDPGKVDGESTSQRKGKCKVFQPCVLGLGSFGFGFILGSYGVLMGTLGFGLRVQGLGCAAFETLHPTPATQGKVQGSAQ